MNDILIGALESPECYDHPVDEVEIHETSVSWILLAGEFAYKIRKPLDFGRLLDFSSLEKRRDLCEREVRLNQGLAPHLYLATIPISGTPQAPRVGDPGAPLEYAVKMRRFSRRLLLDDLQISGGLPLELLNDLVDRLADIHRQAVPVAAGSPQGGADAIRDAVAHELASIDERLDVADDRQRLHCLQTAAEEAHARLVPVFAARHDGGFVRECHDDIRLGIHFGHSEETVTLLADDSESSAEPRWSDVGSDLARLLVDLETRGEKAFARHALNRYLELTGDYGVARVLSYYKLYWALVRARDAVVCCRSDDIENTGRSASFGKCRHYLALAEDYARFHFPYLVIGVGVSGSGKSRFTGEMVKRLGGVRVRSDVERRRLFESHPQADGRQQGVDIHTPEATDHTYRRLAELCGVLLESGLPVCIDATCLTRWQRDLLAWQAEGRGLPVLLVSFEADDATLRRRIEKRSRRGGDVSKAGLDVLERQLAGFEPFGDDERRYLVHLDTTADDATETLVALIQQHIRHVIL